MAKVSAVRVGFGRADRGEFRCKHFNLFDEEQSNLYAELITQANDASSGITIEHIREYSRKTTVREGDGQEQIVTTTEEIVLVVQYWYKPKKSGGNREQARAEQDNLKAATAG